jgi:hypothetical protein
MLSSSRNSRRIPSGRNGSADFDDGTIPSFSPVIAMAGASSVSNSSQPSNSMASPVASGAIRSDAHIRNNSDSISAAVMVGVKRSGMSASFSYSRSSCSNDFSMK